jgi:hypothetical protein
VKKPMSVNQLNQLQEYTEEAFHELHEDTSFAEKDSVKERFQLCVNAEGGLF